MEKIMSRFGVQPEAVRAEESGVLFRTLLLPKTGNRAYGTPPGAKYEADLVRVSMPSTRDGSPCSVALPAGQGRAVRRAHPCYTA